MCTPGWKITTALAVLIPLTSACSSRAQEQAEIADEAGAEAPQVPGKGCTGFDDRHVPAPYYEMHPCLQQLHWKLDITNTESLTLADETLKSSKSWNFKLSASGEQLVWRWEEDGTRNGHYSLQGISNTVDELVIWQKGTATFSGQESSSDLVRRNESREEGNLSGPTAGTVITGISMQDDPQRLCISFAVNAQMRGEMTATIHGDGKTVQLQPGDNIRIAEPLVFQGDGLWTLKGDPMPSTFCAGTDPNPAYNRFDIGTWYGLRADEQSGTWSLDANRAIAIPELPTAKQQWTVKLQVQRVPLTARLPLQH